MLVPHLYITISYSRVLTTVFAQLSFLFISSYYTHMDDMFWSKSTPPSGHKYICTYSVGYATAMLCICGNAQVRNSLKL
jgi:hypothetical protein